ncbi:FIST signal transduction protein [Tateyamaria sp. syn59]|uniref:FIST signal transduction protein n=1 Tax=Tateyamaria sp. syn59 TaxID=2576942 RepID=UPI0011BD71FF|nr:FIST N-terminal domain-containing protein [Tateyamaria sp. syn59]
MHIETIEWSDGSAAARLKERNAEHGSKPDLVALHYACDINPADISALASEMATGLHAATSCKGSVTEGSHAPAPATAFCIWDAMGDYGTALASFDSQSPFDAGAQAASAALEAADRVGEMPDLVLVSATPGYEETVLQGIMSIVGQDVPIFGGTAADNTVSGEWRVSDGAAFHAQGVVVSVLFPSTKLHFAYHNGYEPSANQGQVTRSEGRKLIEIDGKPAAEVYHTWTGKSVLPNALGSEHNILAEATMTPLGVELGVQDGVGNYLLLHPAQLHADGSLGLFAEIPDGTILTQMTGDEQALAERAGRVAAQAVNVGSVAPQDVAGAYMIYCGGCLMAVEDRVSTILDGVRAALPGVPFQSAFTFGEQGQVRGVGNKHGNLMISCVVFTKLPN